MSQAVCQVMWDRRFSVMADPISTALEGAA